jgi:hypothetical protein
MPLTSQIKELGAILQKLIKFEPGLIQIDKHDKHLKLVGVNGDADALGLGVFGVGLGAVTETKFGNRKRLVLTRTRKMRK